MRQTLALFGLALVLFPALSALAVTNPDDRLTPGMLCSSESPDFWKFDYPERVARCQRNVSRDEKQRVADSYGGIPREEWRRYEFDHLIPLCAGGANAAENLWPQPLGEAHDKDALENEICAGMRAGKLTQDAAVQRVHAWFAARIERQAEARLIDSLL